MKNIHKFVIPSTICTFNKEYDENISLTVYESCRHTPSKLGVKQSGFLCVYFRTNPGVWYPWWYEGNCPAQPRLHHTSPPPKNATCCVCLSPWDSPGPAGFEPCTRREETYCNVLTVNCFCIMHINTYKQMQLPSWRCSSGGAPLQSGAAAAVVTLTLADPALSSGSTSYSFL